jgi:hypothetical protein
MYLGQSHSVEQNAIQPMSFPILSVSIGLFDLVGVSLGGT